ncbi:hypothetical protein [Roseicella sp. DB1501]|uniref:hypothetical protein n=1 Tax=Roseicella sp. DB1501 TaxID=2730925 RepID=UPI001492CE54|nr:hypothetical protein [Roseicella sp. DB1501]NOG73228.1 hypothetical protein [Roseicella sp. DB1501]
MFRIHDSGILQAMVALPARGDVAGCLFGAMMLYTVTRRVDDRLANPGPHPGVPSPVGIADASR